MASCKLPFFLEGKEFEPEIYIEDLEAYDKAEREALKGGGSADLVRARLTFLQKVLARHHKGKTPLGLKLTVNQIMTGWEAVWTSAFKRHREGDGPLALGSS